MTDAATKSGNFVRHTKSNQSAVAVLGHPKRGRDPKSSTVREIPSEHRRDIARGPCESKFVPVAQSTIEFKPGVKVLPAKTAGPGSRCQSQWTAYSHSVTELPGLVAQVLFSNKVFGNVPTFVIARKNQLRLNLTLFFRPCFNIGLGMLSFRTESHDLSEGFVGSVDILKLNIEHWVDPVFAPQEPKTIFPTEASEDGAVVSSRLSVEIKFRCPPTFDAILKLCPGTHERVG